MDFRYPPESEVFRQEVRAFLKEAVTADYIEEQRTLTSMGIGHGSATQRFVKQLRERGWLTLHWPTDYGGQGRSIFDQAVFAEEIARAGASTHIVGSVGLNMVAPALMVFGTEEQKRSVLPKIAAGEMNFCQMFTEPEAGSDLASLKTRAVRDGDDFVLNGTKVFNSAHLASHGYLMARTDPEAPKHRGISLFILDLKSPGVDIRPLMLITGDRHNMVHLQDVRVPVSSVLGEVNRGWYHAAVTLDFERAGVGSITRGEAEVNRLIAYARTTQRNGKPISAHSESRKRLIRAFRDARLSRAFGLRVLDLLAKGKVASIEASEANLHGNKEALGRLSETKALIYGMYGQLRQDTPYSVANGDGFDSWLVLAGRHGAGSIEIQKNIIAQRGLGLPR